MQENDKYYEEIKDLIIDTEATIRVKDYAKNKVVLNNYYEIGKLIIEAQGGEKKAQYGDRLIKRYSKKLTSELNKNYSITLLKNIRQFFLFVKKSPTMSDHFIGLSWSHYVELLKVKDISEFKYYVNISLNNNITVRQLREKIKNKEYERLSEDTKLKLIENKKPEITELVKDPIVISNPNNIEVITEKMLQKIIMEDIYIIF